MFGTKNSLRVAALAVVFAFTTLGSSTPALAQDGGGSGIRLEFQGRLDVFNTFGISGNTFSLGGGGVGFGLSMVPLVTIGPRLLDGALFVGIGAGYTEFSNTACSDADDGGCADQSTVTTTSLWSISPVVSYEFLSTELAGLYAIAWFNLGQQGGTSVVTEGANTPTATIETDPGFWWGVDIGIGIRAKISPAFSIGTEWGWGIASVNDAGDNTEDSSTVHGIWGTITLSASLGL